jgi:hypothetical protein
VPPTGDLHAELNALMGVKDPGRRVQRLLDSTARTHGPAHRHDPVHSLDGAIIELAKQGRVTADDVNAVVAHLTQDAAFDRVWKSLPPGPVRQTAKALGMPLLTKALRKMRTGR